MENNTIRKSTQLEFAMRKIAKELGVNEVK